jgi:putative hydrolase of the HAD superfamily
LRIPKKYLEPRHKAVFFDAGGTLLEPYPSVGDVYSSYAKKYGCEASPQELNRIFHNVWESRNNLTALQTGVGEKEEKAWWKDVVWEVFKQVGGIESFDQFFDELYYSFASKETWRVFEEVAEVLIELRRSGFYLGIISNWDSRLSHICSTLGLDKYFDSILISALVGFAKPDPRIFQTACDTAGVLPEEAIHIGDSLEDDYYGAQSAGLSAVFLDRLGRSRYPEIATISNLSSILDPK